jgi:hypothetical protein
MMYLETKDWFLLYISLSESKQQLTGSLMLGKLMMLKHSWYHRNACTLASVSTIYHDQTLYDRMSERTNDGSFMMNIGSTDAAPEYITWFGLVPGTVVKGDDDSWMGTAGEHKMSGDDDLGDSRDHECLNDDSELIVMGRF